MSSLQRRLGFPHEGLQGFALATKCSDLIKPRKSENDGVGWETNVGEVGREVVGGSVGERKTHKNKNTVMWHRNWDSNLRAVEVSLVG